MPYQELGLRTRYILAEGGCAVVDAVFDRPGNRRMIEEAASERRHVFSGFWLEADPALLWQRVEARTGGCSDATVDVLAHQLWKGSGTVDWIRLEAALPAEKLADEILHHLAIKDADLVSVAADI